MNCSWGQDPFDKTQRNRSQFDNAQTVMEQTEIISSDVPNNLCGADENRQAAEIPLNALKLVGVVISKDKAFALLQDQGLQIYSVLEGVDVAQEGYIVEKSTKTMFNLCVSSESNVIVVNGKIKFLKEDYEEIFLKCGYF